MTISRLLPILLCFCVYSVQAQRDHDDHDDEEVVNQLSERNLKIEMAEDRTIGGKDVTAIPVDAIFSEKGKDFVLIQGEEDRSQFDRSEVNLGMSDGVYVEAKTGVFPGDNLLLKTKKAPVPLYRQSAPTTAQRAVPQNREPVWSPRIARPGVPANRYPSKPVENFNDQQVPKYQYTPETVDRSRAYQQPEFNRVLPQEAPREEFYAHRQWIEQLKSTIRLQQPYYTCYPQQNLSTCPHDTQYICPQENLHPVHIYPAHSGGCSYRQPWGHRGYHCDHH